MASGEKKMRFSRGEVVFYKLKNRSKTANVAEVKEELTTILHWIV